mgnify:CR=1 FL=1
MNSLPNEKDILGVEIKLLKSFVDDRGFFREIFRSSDPLFKNGVFGQWSHSKMTHNVVKAWHYHHVQTDWWYVPFGKVETVLYDNREESPTYKNKIIIPMGDSLSFKQECFDVCVRIPPGVLHGCKVLSDSAHLFYITSHTYNPDEEGRIPYNSDTVPHNWGKDVITVENDRRFFTPQSTREKVA